MKIFLTGGTGFVGKAFVAYAEKHGHEITHSGEILTHKNEIQQIKWADFGALVHLAAIGVRRISPDRTWEKCMAVNFSGARDLLLSLSDSRVTIPVFLAGSVREWEMSDRLDYWSDPYITSKRLFREFVDEWSKQYRGRVTFPYCERINCDADMDIICRQIINSIT